jgi:hypothetical protein
MEDGTAAENLPTWGNWQWGMKFLPAEFHRRKSISKILMLAKENWADMGPDDAELTILSIGLALRDMEAAHFLEEGEDAEDVPDWVKTSPFVMNDMQKLLEVWERQLPAEDETPVDVDPKGKGKAKATGDSGKRKAKSSDEVPDTEERRPA